MPQAIRTVLPLAIVTGTSMLAMDLFLPAVPTLQAGGRRIKARSLLCSRRIPGLWRWQ